jgi:hypothetical protein
LSTKFFGENLGQRFPAKKVGKFRQSNVLFESDVVHWLKKEESQLTSNKKTRPAAGSNDCLTLLQFPNSDESD